MRGSITPDDAFRDAQDRNPADPVGTAPNARIVGARPYKTANQAHGFLLEFGISLPKGLALVRRLPSTLDQHQLPLRLVALLTRLHQHFCDLDEQVKAMDKEMAIQLEADDLEAAC